MPQKRHGGEKKSPPSDTYSQIRDGSAEIRDKLVMASMLPGGWRGG